MNIIGLLMSCDITRFSHLSFCSYDRQTVGTSRSKTDAIVNSTYIFILGRFRGITILFLGLNLYKTFLFVSILNLCGWQAGTSNSFALIQERLGQRHKGAFNKISVKLNLNTPDFSVMCTTAIIVSFDVDLSTYHVTRPAMRRSLDRSLSKHGRFANYFRCRIYEYYKHVWPPVTPKKK